MTKKDAPPSTTPRSSGRPRCASSPSASRCGRPSSGARTSSSTPTRCARSSASPGWARDDVVVEVGPGLGSLTLALLPVVKHVTAVEVDPRLAGALEQTVRSLQPENADKLRLVAADALTITKLPGPDPTALVANLPYNISVPVVLSFLQRFPTIERVLVMVQLEVAERLAAKPGSKIYGVPSLKAAWYADVELAGRVGRNVFWPAPNVDSGLVALRRRKPPKTTATREEVFRCIDAAFLQRRKALRGALASWAGSPDAAERRLVAAGVDPRTRGEQLDITAFARIAEARPSAAPDADAGGPGRRRGHTS